VTRRPLKIAYAYGLRRPSASSLLNPSTSRRPRIPTATGSPGLLAGRHLEPGYIANQLRTSIGVRAARLGTLHELTKLAPTAIIAEVLGYSPATIELHAKGSATWRAADRILTRGSPDRPAVDRT
jgi:hypothetical protein